MVHHERAARALERLGILCYDVAKPMKECGCQETVFTNSLVGTKTGGRPALDVVVQRSILMMLMELQQRMGNTFVIVSHDLGVHYQVTGRLGIMYAGTMVELGPTSQLFDEPLHPYTQMLIGALPKVGDHRPKEGIPGAPPSLRQPIVGCSFEPRCPQRMAICKTLEPAFVQVRPGRSCACHLVPAMKPQPVEEAR